MLKDTLSSIFDNLKERTTNPFLGTLIIVWIFRNWSLVYGLFNFGTGTKLKDKLQYITDYYNNQPFVLNMVFVVLITLGVLIFTYCMLAISRFLTDTYDKIIIPFIAKKTDKGSVVLKSEYIILQEVVKALGSRLEEERLAKVGAQNEREQADQRLISALSTKNESSNMQETKSDNKMSDTEQSYSRVSNLIYGTLNPDIFNNTVNKIKLGEIIPNNDDIVKLLL